MTIKQAEEKDRVVNAISQEINCSWYEAEKIARHLKRLNTQINWWNEAAFNQELYFRYWDKDGENETLNRLEELARNYVANKIGCEMRINHDPRGHALRLYLQNYYNTMDGETTAPTW